MSRVSENSAAISLRVALNRTKAKLEDLQLKGSSLRRMNRPSDDPMSNTEAMSITSNITNNKQFIRNSDYAVLFLSTAEKSLSQLTDILAKAKEIAITQSSDFYDANIRKNIAHEISQLRAQTLAIANTRIGKKYIFSGSKTLTKPFDLDGNYNGNNQAVKIEVSKDFFIPFNLTGKEIFMSNQMTKDNKNNRNKNINSGIFKDLEKLQISLESNSPELTRSLLTKLDDSTSRIITLRTKIGSIINSIEQQKTSIEANNIDKQARRSKLVDADVAELFSDITKEKQILQTTYKATEATINKTLLDYIR